MNRIGNFLGFFNYEHWCCCTVTTDYNTTTLISKVYRMYVSNSSSVTIVRR